MSPVQASNLATKMTTSPISKKKTFMIQKARRTLFKNPQRRYFVPFFICRIGRIKLILGMEGKSQFNSEGTATRVPKTIRLLSSSGVEITHRSF
jgi:hypothetical protein